MTWRELEARWKFYTLDKAEAEILGAKERARVKHVASDSDRLVAVTGGDVLKRKRDAVLANHHRH